MKLIYPLESPVRTRGFYYLASFYILGQHLADDYVPRYGSALGVPIKAVHTGAVIGDAWDQYGGYFIMVQGDDGFVSVYRHLRTDAPPVVGQRVQQGEVIGYVGNTGLSMGAHLHFDLWHKVKQDSTAVYKRGWWAHNPALYLGKGNTGPVVPEEDDMTLGELAAALRTIKVKLDDPDSAPLTTDEQALYDNIVALSANIMPAYVNMVKDARGHKDIWNGIVGHPHSEVTGDLDLSSLRITQVGS